MSGGRPFSANRKSNARLSAEHEKELKRRGGAVLHLRLKPGITDRIDLAAMNLGLDRTRTVRRLLELAMIAKLDRIGT
jgi:hypothetical protein